MKKLLGAVAFACLTALPAFAQGYFEGKTVTYIIATNPGGNYDAYGRLIGRHLEKKLGADRVLFKNLPGAGHIIGANTLYASDPDGLTIGTFNTGLIYAQILQTDGVQFDLSNFSWIGKAASDVRAVVLGNNSGLSSFDDLVNSEQTVNFAASGIGSASYNETKMLADGLDLKINMIPGYQGNEGEMAMLRGEVVGQVGSKASLQPFVDAGNGYFALVVGKEEGIPSASSFAKTDKAKAIVSLIEANSNLGRLTAAPPGVPAEILEELRTAYMAVMQDPEFLAEAEKLGLPIDAAPGGEVADLMLAALQQSPETVAIISEALDVEIPTIKVSTNILALEDRNKVVTFMSGDAEVKGEISGSRTVVTLNGAEAQRDDLAVGMNCEMEYDPASDVNEFKSVVCSGEAMAAATGEMTVSSQIVALADGNKSVTFMADGTEKTGSVSGSRTALTIDGAEAKRDALAVGMACDLTYEDGAEIEFKSMACSNAAAGAMTVNSKIAALGDGNKAVTFIADGAEKTGSVSGSRTALTIDGAEAKRDALAVGMTCDLTFEDGADIEFSAVSCTSN
jgi:tripartite-type tricarboxylate transporter receptor subunit TctC/sarcosine oxidase gamma subunit